MNIYQFNKISVACLATLLLSTNVVADKSSLNLLQKEVSELRKITKKLLQNTELTTNKYKAKIIALEETQQVLIDETSNLKNGSYTTVNNSKSHHGLGNAASKVYYSNSPLSIGGYGEMYISSQIGDSDNKRKLDVYRFVPYIGYKFTDNIILNTELEFEHGGVTDDGTAQGGEVIVEFMYLDFLINEKLNIRLGNFLMPMGLINKQHEPTLFNTVQRPETAKYIIPSTWNEGGVMAYGNLKEGLSYNFAIVSALSPGVNGSKWIRGGRGGSSRQTDPSVGFIGRLDFTGINGLLIGTSTYYSPSSNGNNSSLRISDIHLDYKARGVRIYGTYADVSRSGASNIASDTVKSASGGYVNLSYDLFSSTNKTTSLPVFVQYESYNPEKARADGTSGSSTKTTTIGVNYFPHEQVVLKLDYAMKSKASLKDNSTSLSMGFIF